MNTPDFIKTIEDHAAKLGIAPSTLCERAGQGGRFYARIKSGKRCWPETADKVRAYIAANPPETESAAQ